MFDLLVPIVFPDQQRREREREYSARPPEPSLPAILVPEEHASTYPVAAPENKLLRQN